MDTMSEDRDGRVFVWVSIGAPDARPVRAEITACTGCAALVPADRVDVHVRWHRERDRTAQ